MLAAKAQSLRSCVNPNDLRFLNPRDTPTAIQNFCREPIEVIRILGGGSNSRILK
jgi:sugar (pentulose or hexulose) kinase